jgi:hypothetical protein
MLQIQNVVNKLSAAMARTYHGTKPTMTPEKPKYSAQTLPCYG